MNGQIPIVETYRGVGIHTDQSGQRIATVVRPAIDHVHATIDLDELFAYCGNACHPPEARLFAAAKCEALFDLAVNERRSRPAIDIAVVKAKVAGLASAYWRDPSRYCSLLDVHAAGNSAAVRDYEIDPVSGDAPEPTDISDE